MRKLIVIVALGLLVSSPAALAKERNLQMLGTPTAKAGQAWAATISVKMDGKLSAGRAPTVRIISTAGRTINVPARATLKAGIYRASVVFPKAGTWRVIVVDNETGRAYEFSRMRVRAT